jgi:hypothetical protein
MNAHAHRPLVSRRSRPRTLGRFTAWVNARWQARRVRRLEEETVVYLSTMDAKLINDIGMDIDRLSELTPRPSDLTGKVDSTHPQHSKRDKRS